MTSVNSNNYTSFRHYYLLYREGRQITKKGGKEKSTLLETFSCRRKKDSSFLLKEKIKKDHF